ncbi:MAG: A/G-specific adenine glycosylase [Alphaproteobacteria bacterium]
MTSPSDNLLRWYDASGRDLPWRVRGERHTNPYHVWLSEIMLQQTTVITVIPYFNNFLMKWPSIEALAKASQDDVLHAWQGLGYYSRARNLHKAAQVITQEYDGTFPEEIDALKKLPGVGDYTAAAIASIAFGQEAVIMDGNVVRVISRLFGIHTPYPDSKKEIIEKAATLTPQSRVGDYNSAIMDLGATICTPKKTQCDRCPWIDICVAYKKDQVALLPVKKPKKKIPTRIGKVFWITNKKGEILIRKRPEKGLFAGRMEIPWSDKNVEIEAITKVLPAPMEELPVIVKHTFTHFHLELHVVIGAAASAEELGGIWCAMEDLKDYAFPTLIQKVIKICQKTAL